MFYFRNNQSFQINNSTILEKNIKLKEKKKKINQWVFWGIFNLFLLIILIYDASYVCPINLTYFDYCEYTLIVILFLNVLYYLKNIIVFCLKKEETRAVIEPKKLPTPEAEQTFSLTPRGFMGTPTMSPISPLPLTPVNMTALSWRSNLSQNNSPNYSVSSPSWTYHKGGSPNSTYETNCLNKSNVDLISDEEELEKYIKEYESNNSMKDITTQSPQYSNILSSFWSHPITKTSKDMSSFLKTSQYQLSTLSPTTSGETSNSKEDKSPSIKELSSTIWFKLNIDIMTLTRWNENLRKWISQTILERLVNEFNRINESLDKQGMSDIKIGNVGLDRLRKTAQIAHIVSCIPSLLTLIPFLEVTANQEYLVKRIRELANGGCMSSFKWNGGSSFNGKEWDESLPTDSEIIMHLLASYLDTQLMPSPSMPDVKPFTGFHYIRYKEKIPPLTPNSLYIQQASAKPPYFRVIVGETIYDMVKGYNNLFHTILFFLYTVSEKEHGMLGRVYLGKSGVNMLWIIDK